MRAWGRFLPPLPHVHDFDVGERPPFNFECKCGKVCRTTQEALELTKWSRLDRGAVVMFYCVLALAIALCVVMLVT
jgi:hypothetical protein